MNDIFKKYATDEIANHYVIVCFTIYVFPIPVDYKS